MTSAFWSPSVYPPFFSPQEIADASLRFRESAAVIADPNAGWRGVGLGGDLATTGTPMQPGRAAYPVLAMLPPMYPEWLGDRSFLEVHRVRFPYVVGEMAHAIASTQLVIAIAQAQMLGFYGAGGVPPERVEAALYEMEQALNPHGLSWGANLIHSPNEPELEEAVVDLYIRRGLRRVCASAYMRLTPAVVRFACHGLQVDASGQIVRGNHLFAKLSRVELAKLFLSPAPADMVAALVEKGQLTAHEAELSKYVPLAEDITVEADSGGHTDNRPLVALFPAVAALRDQLAAQYGYRRPIRIGAGGGLGTPGAVAGAFALGAAYVLTGSVNQGCVEAGLSPTAKQMLAQAEMTDVIMAPAPDMFEQGVKVQVLKRGTMFASRAGQLYEIYRTAKSIEDIPADLKKRIETEMFQRTLEEVWADTKSFFERRNPSEVERAERDPKHKMALVFRWYVGQSSHWAIKGDPKRRLDYQIWCGPAMGAFNAWAKGTFLEDPANRTAVQVARNLMEGAAVITRAQQLRSYGVPVPDAAFQFPPRPLQ